MTRSAPILSLLEVPAATPALFASLSRCREELEAVADRARDARVKLAVGEATTGATALMDIENRCRDALAVVEETLPEVGRPS
jgi:hypothetical protein